MQKHHHYYLYRKDQGLPWFLIPEIKDFVEDLEEGTIRKNNRSTRTDCFQQVENNVHSTDAFFKLNSLLSKVAYRKSELH